MSSGETEYQSDKQFVVQNVIGRGSQGVTYKVTGKGTGREYAAKYIEMNPSRLEHAKNEIYALKRLSMSPHCFAYIPCYYGAISEDDSALIIMSEYIPGKTLQQIFRTMYTGNIPFNTGTLVRAMMELLLTVDYIHKMGFAHRDIKGDNIIMNSKNDRLYLVDFGLSCHNYTTCEIPAGAMLSLPPEIFSPDYVGTLRGAQRHDIWSLGVVFYRMVNGRYPHERYKDGRLSKAEMLWVASGPMKKSAYRGSSDPDINRFVNSVVDGMLNPDPNERPNCRMLLEYIKDNIDLYNINLDEPT